VRPDEESNELRTRVSGLQALEKRFDGLVLGICHGIILFVETARKAEYCTQSSAETESADKHDIL
jgi:hypothetical protein